MIFGQDLNLKAQWENYGPVDQPIGNNISAKGIGPIEFIQISETNPMALLAGSLYGGLFASDDGGNTWINSGSDRWLNSGCGWACFHPKNAQTWFATSIEQAKKGKPGKTGLKGGILRTVDNGLTWENIASYANFDHNSYVSIYGLRFHSKDNNKLYALTSIGLFLTENCLAKSVVWKKISPLKGSIYDLEIIGETVAVAVDLKRKWEVFFSEGQEFVSLKVLKDETRKISHVTIEKAGLNFYVLIDFASAKDEIWKINAKTKSIDVICNRGRVSFGAGYTFTLNPFNSNEIIVGNGLRVRKWLIDAGKFQKLNGDYHVDVEHAAYHPTIENKLFLATHGGVYKSDDNGLSWSFSSSGIGNAEVLGLAVSETDPNEIAVGLNHDGTVVRADWNKTGIYTWRQVNGGDALLPLISPTKSNVVFTSNQYTGGGLYYSKDTAVNNINIHGYNKVKTSGWAMASVLHPFYDSILFFNFTDKSPMKNIDVARTFDPSKKNSIQIISNFKASHGLEKYQVFSLFNSKFHPDILLAYVLDYTKDDNGKSITNHRLFKLSNVLDTSSSIVNNWRELELPRNGWVSSIVMDQKKWFKQYVSYTGGAQIDKNKPNDKSMIFYAKYRKSSHVISRNWDISSNIPSGIAGKYNMVYVTGKRVFIATQSGVYMGTKSTLRGGKLWRKVGSGLPHCKVYGLHYHEAQNYLLLV